MSKSLGNFTSLTDLLERSDARAYRLLVLRSHYRSPIEVTAATVADAEKGLERLDALARRFSLPDVLAEAGGAVVAGVGPAAEADPTAVGELLERMDDDLDTPGALAGVFELVSRANAAADAGDAAGAARTARTVAVACAALGLALRGGAAAVDAGSARLAAERDAARAGRDWARADALRDELVARGWTVEDGPEGTVLRH